MRKIQGFLQHRFLSRINSEVSAKDKIHEEVKSELQAVIDKAKSFILIEILRFNETIKVDEEKAKQIYSGILKVYKYISPFKVLIDLDNPIHELFGVIEKCSHLLKEDE